MRLTVPLSSHMKAINCCLGTWILIFITVGLLIESAPPFVVAQPNSSVHNINSGYNYSTIQEAIDANETLDGHILFVEEGVYYENVSLNFKSLSIVGDEKSRTIIDGSLSIERAQDVDISSLTVQNMAPKLAGISVRKSRRVNINQTIISGSSTYGIFVADSSNCILSDNSVFSNSNGIYVDNDSSSEILHNNVSLSSGFGIGITGSGNNHVSDNNVSSNVGIGISIFASADNTVSGNCVSENGEGIQLSGQGSKNNTLAHNQVLSNIKQGILLTTQPGNNTLSNNTITRNEYGIWLEEMSHDNILSYNEITSNHKDGIYLDNSINNVLSENNASFNGNHGIYGSLSTNNVLMTNALIHNSIGIQLLGSSANVLASNLVTNNYLYGICLNKSSSNILSRNNISISSDAIALLFSANNIIENNKASFADYGADLSVSSNNTIYNNTFSFDGYGISVDGSNNRIQDNTIFSNRIDGIHVGGTDNCISGNTVQSNDYNGITIYFSDENTVLSNIASQNKKYGIEIRFSIKNTISGNNVSFNELGGIHIDSGDHNTLVDNTFRGNLNGIHLSYDSSDNMIFHNNFIDNSGQLLLEFMHTSNRWNNGAEGNYWSDYNQTYPNATEIDGSGVWNTPYVIDANNQDNYPLKDSWEQNKTFNLTWNERTFEVIVESNSTVSSLTFNQTARLVAFTTTGPSNTSGFCNVTLPKELLNTLFSEQWKVFVNNETVSRYIQSNATHTFIYFTFTHSTKTINMVGTNPVDDVQPTANAGQNQTVYEGTEILLDGSASWDNIEIANYTWSFEDQTQKVFFEKKLTYNFLASGTHLVTLQVTDLRGNSNTATIAVTILSIPVWFFWWFWVIIALALAATIMLPFIVRYYRNFRKQKEIVLAYESGLEKLPITHPDRARARWIKDYLERKEMMEKWQKMYGFKIRPASTFDDAANKLGIPRPAEEGRD